MTPERKRELARIWAGQPDWFAFCRMCGRRVEGCPSEVKRHVCGPGGSGGSGGPGGPGGGER